MCLSVPNDEVELTDLRYVNEYAAPDARLGGRAAVPATMPPPACGSAHHACVGSDDHRARELVSR